MYYGRDCFDRVTTAVGALENMSVTISTASLY
jgi:hypothetical protein